MMALHAALVVLSSVLHEQRPSSLPAIGRSMPWSAHLRRPLSLRGGSGDDIPLLVTDLDLEVALEEAGGALVVVDFYAEWCKPCKRIAPLLDQLAHTHAKRPDKIKFFKVDVDESRELSAAQGVRSMPTIQFFRNGEKVHEIVGGDVAAIRAEVTKAVQNPVLTFLRSEKILLVAAAVYVTIPWQRLQRVYA